ncbi:MAG: SEC-C domain-containing protein [Planctomycetota bacterium]|nr:SEC-C domain-containing protein [Planctomycetota bacterium]
MTAEAVAAPARRDARSPVSTLVLPVAPLRRAEASRPNAPCACGSGLKAKKCCLANGTETHAEAAAPVLNAPTPSHEPSPDPTLEPTLEPALEPTLEPTLEPSLEPKLEHSPEPSLEPTPDLAPATAGLPEPLPEPESASYPDEPPPSDVLPLGAEGAGCAAWMRLTGLYPWKPRSLAERRAGLDKLTRHVRHWMRARRARGAFRPLRARALHAGDAGGAAAFGADLDAALDASQAEARTHAEPSWELAAELEIGEAKLNQLCREHTGLSARDWWDAVRAEDAGASIRAEIEAALDGWVLDRSAQIRRRGVQAMDLHRALRQQRRAAGSTAADRAWNLGYKNAARLNLALWRATGRTMQQLEAECLKEIFETWAYDHRTCRLCAKNAEDVVSHGAHGEVEGIGAAGWEGYGPHGDAVPDAPAWEPGVRIA